MLAKRTELRPLPSRAPPGLGRRAAQPGGDRCLARGDRARDLRRLRADRDGHLAGNLVGDQIRDGSMGRPLPGFRAADRRRDPRGRGRAAARRSSAGYLGAEPYAGEWWSTGDVVREDDDGYLWYEGRDDDLILSAGYRIGPFEVESALLTHPSVAEAAAVAAPDPERGAVVRAIVVLREGEASDELARELQEHVKATTAPYKYPRIVEFADELPKTASGKIKRAQLRAD